MAHIEQMIQDMCPNGVEWKTLGEVCIVKTAPMKLDKKEYQEQGLYPIVDQGQKFIVGYTDNAEALVPADDYIIFGDHTREIKYVDFTFAQGADGVKILKTKNEILPRFLYHILKNTQIPSRGYNRHWTIAKDIEIPLPPLEIQEKIVECLDKFSALAAELQAELQLRRKQYEYYRTQLLTPHSESNSANKTDDCNWEWKTLGEIFELRGGYTPSKNNPDFWEGGSIPWFRMEDIRLNGRILEDSIQHITPAAIKGKGLFKKNTFILATTATIGEHALLIADSLANQQFTNLKIRKSLENSLLTKFVFHYMFIVDEYCKAHTNVSGFESVDMDALKKMPFPIPPLAEQKRIADILDKFEALTTSLSDGIPAEQAAQQKRYEYYRDLLLTFPRKEV